MTGGHRSLYPIQVRLLAQPDDNELLAVLLFDPLDTLQLGVNHQRPALRVGQYRSVLRRHTVARQSLVVPPRDGGRVCEHREDVGTLGAREGDLLSYEEGQPVFEHEVMAVLAGETTHVGDEGSDQEHVTGYGL